MCYDEGRMQAYIDGQLGDREAGEIQEHLNTCSECGALYRRLLENDMVVRISMENFFATDRERFDAELAWRRLRLEKIKAGEKQDKKGIRREKMKIRKYMTAAAAVLLLVGLFSYSPVRSAAADFLTIFRSEKVQAIAITPQDMEQVEKMMKDGTGKVDIENFGKFEVSGERGKPVGVTEQEARAAVDFDLKLPALEGYGKPVFEKTPAMKVTMQMEVDKVNSLLKELGSSEQLPEELSGKEFSLEVPASVTARYRGAGGEIMLIQSRGPSITASTGVDVDALRNALLSIPALPENLKKQLSAVDDWQHTALVPVAAGGYNEVSVNGAGGLFIKGDSGTDRKSALVWQQNGVIYVLAGNRLDQGKALDIAANIK
ncbi:MAG: anti-sigma factor family protein [Bacillota bacterium]